MTNQEKFNELVPLYLEQYKRVNNKEFRSYIKYERGFVLFAGTRFRLSKFEEMTNTLSKRPDYKAPEPIKTFDDKLEEIAKHVIRKMKEANENSSTVLDSEYDEMEMEWVDYLREVLKD